MDYICGSIIELILFIIIIFAWVLTKIKIKSKASFAFDLTYSLIAFVLLAYNLSKWSILEQPKVKNYINTVKALTELVVMLLILVLLFYVIIGFVGKKYSLRIDNFNVGGINIFFDKSSDIFIKTVGTFILSKRSLFKFDRKIDNISEVLNAYYDTYKFIKDNLELLDNDKDAKLRELSITILRKLNRFLSQHQNDYRRWYHNVIKENVIKGSSGENILVHETTIEDVQKNYYRYEELLSDINDINEFFKHQEIEKEFDIKYFDWSDKNA